MTRKQIAASSGTRSPSSSPRRSAGGFEAHAHAMPMFELSFDVEPVVSVVRRHVKLSKAADEAITRDLIELLGRAIVQLRTASHKPAARQVEGEGQDDALLTTEQAARLAGVSRPYMAKLIDAGDVMLHHKVGNQRRVLRSAVLHWQAVERARQAKSLKRLGKDLDEEIFSS